MAVLKQAQRKKMARSTFALPPKRSGENKTPSTVKGRYPIPDLAHARNALARVSQHGTPAEKATVRAKVHAKYPGIQQASDKKEK